METVLASRSNRVTIGPGHPFCIIGERINPTNRRSLADAMAGGDLAMVVDDAVAQVTAGATVLDVNAGVPLADEAALLTEAVRRVQDVVDLPLCLDSSSPAALEAALAVCDGKPLVNSVTAEPKRLEAILPIVAARGAAVIALAHGSSGIPRTAEGRLEAAREIVEAAAQWGIPPSDVVVDPLALTVATDPEAARVTLETIRLLSNELGVNTTVGASNISFGMPDRPALIAAFLPMAMAAGLTSAIMNPLSAEAVQGVAAADVLLGHDAFGGRWIAAFRARTAA